MRAWREAWEDALYGARGFYLAGAGPGAHFRTSVHVGTVLAEVVHRLAGLVAAQLGPGPLDVVDLGAGRAELLTGLLRLGVPEDWRLHAVERAPRPPGLDERIAWSGQLPEVRGLLLANEWLDVVPLDVVQDGRLVLVDETGTEALGPPAPPSARAWADRWWPTGARVEVGTTRDAAWRSAVGQVAAGLAVAVDYGHALGRRRPTLTGYRRGQQVAPVPDGSCDLTAHVALDSTAQATGSLLLRQREVLRALGVTGRLPSYDGDAAAHLAALERTSAEAELLDLRGLGGFGWLVRPVGVELPWPLRRLPPWPGG